MCSLTRDGALNNIFDSRLIPDCDIQNVRNFPSHNVKYVSLLISPQQV